MHAQTNPQTHHPDYRRASAARTPPVKVVLARAFLASHGVKPPRRALDIAPELSLSKEPLKPQASRRQRNRGKARPQRATALVYPPRRPHRQTCSPKQVGSRRANSQGSSSKAHPDGGWPEKKGPPRLTPYSNACPEERSFPRHTPPSRFHTFSPFPPSVAPPVKKLVSLAPGVRASAVVGFCPLAAAFPWPFHAHRP
jgi:hypothetical protein